MSKRPLLQQKFMYCFKNKFLIRSISIGFIIIVFSPLYLLSDNSHLSLMENSSCSRYLEESGISINDCNSKNRFFIKNKVLLHIPDMVV